MLRTRYPKGFPPYGSGSGVMYGPSRSIHLAKLAFREVVALALVLIMLGVSERDDACDDTGPRPLQSRLLPAQEVDHAAVLDSPVGRHVGQ